MRVALFFDGKNHTKDQRRAAADRWVDHGALARFAVQHVGGSDLAFAWYYTGVPAEDLRDDGATVVTRRRAAADDGPRESAALAGLLEELERRPGFFVKRFPRRSASRDCPHCGIPSAYTEEKMVDTSLVADLVLQAARGTFDVAVVFSGDADLAPGVQAVHDLGRKCWVATYGTASMSRQIARAAWATIDLTTHLEAFSSGDLTAPSAAEPESDAPDTDTPATGGIDASDREVLRELRRAISHFAAGGGFVGGHYFVHRWKGREIPDSPDLRRSALQRLLHAGLVDTYTVDGKSALRVLAPDEAEQPIGADPGPPGVVATFVQVSEPRRSRS